MDKPAIYGRLVMLSCLSCNSIVHLSTVVPQERGRSLRRTEGRLDRRLRFRDRVQAKVRVEEAAGGEKG